MWRQASPPSMISPPLSVMARASLCEGSYLRLIDSCMTQFKAQGPSRTCNESKEEEKKSCEAGGMLGGSGWLFRASEGLRHSCIPLSEAAMHQPR